MVPECCYIAPLCVSGGSSLHRVHQPPSPASLGYVGPPMVTREKQLEDALRAAEAERDFLREMVRALVERRGPVRIG